jgi:5'(3')-deoxyribonucleotidase
MSQKAKDTDKENLILDCDGLVLHTTPSLREFMNHFYNIPSIEEDYVTHHTLDAIIQKYRKNFNLERNVIYGHIADHYHTSPRFHKNITTLPHAKEVILELKEIYNLHIATARTVAGKKILEGLLDKHIPKCVSSIHFVHTHHGKGNITAVSKKEFIEQLPGVNAGFVDDSPHEIKELVGVLPTILFDPKNKHKKVRGSTARLKTWLDIGDTFL